MSPASTGDCGGVLYGDTKVYVRSECGKDGWVPSGGKAPLSQWFSVWVVSVPGSSIDLSLLGW